MPKLLRKCVNCGRYTLKKDTCPYCKGKLVMPYPVRFSPADKYGEYRRRYKMEKAVALSNGDAQKHQAGETGKTPSCDSR